MHKVRLVEHGSLYIALTVNPGVLDLSNKAREDKRTVRNEEFAISTTTREV